MVTAAPPSKVAGPVRSDGNKRAPLLPAYRALCVESYTHSMDEVPALERNSNRQPGGGPHERAHHKKIGWLMLFGFIYFAMLNAGISSIDVSEV